MSVYRIKFFRFFLISAFSVATLTTTILSCKGPIGLGSQVDIRAPEITLGTYADGSPIVSGDYVKGAITLNGTYDDDLAISSIEVSTDGGTSYTTATVDTANKSWSFPVDTTSFSDGEKDVIVKITDASEKESTTSGFLIFDNTPPLVLITVAPGVEYVATDQLISIKGEAADPFRVKQVHATINSQLVSVSSVNGTYSWSAAVTADVSGTYPMTIYAEDFAGNTSSVVFLYDDLRTLNGNKALTAEQANEIYSEGGSIADFPLTKTLMTGAARTQLSIEIDLSLDLPQITINNPVDGDALGGGAVIIGRVLDDDGVDIDSVKIAFDLSEAQLSNEANYSWDAANPVNVKSESGQAVNFVYEIPGSLTPSVPHTVHIFAKDDNGLKGFAPYPDDISFTFDAGAPEIEVTSHASGDIENSTSVLIAGTATDDSAVDKVEYSLDSGSSWTEIVITPPGNTFWDETINLGTDGAHNIKFKATDDTSGISIYNLYLEVDTADPTHTFVSPTSGTFVNGFVEVRGSFSDNNGIKEAYVLVGTETPSNPYRLVSNPNSWTYQFNSQEYDNATYATENPPGSGVWDLVIKTRAIDFAGNQYDSDSSYLVKVDNLLDRPLVVILNPSDGAAIGGSTRVTGNASDDDAVYKVFMQIDVDGDGNYTHQFDLNGNTSTDQPSDLFEDETQWYELSGTSVWTADLNAGGEFYSPVSTDATKTGDGNVNIKVRAQDTKDGGSTGDIYGDAVTIAVRFDDTLPFVANVTPESGEYVKEIATLDAEFYDDQQIDNMYISFNNGGTYTELFSPSASPSDYSLDHITSNPSYDQYNLSYSIDTEDPAITSNILNGLLYVRLKLIDNANYQYIETVTLSVDNTYPTTTVTDNGVSDVTGSDFSIQGTAVDTGPVNGIAKIEVYITDKAGTTFYQPDTFATTQSTAGQTLDLSADGGGVVTYPSSYASMIVTVNDLNEDGVDGSGDDPADGYHEGLSLSGGTYNWYFLFDSTGFDDGEYTVHAIGFDKALNGFYTSRDIFIKNNKPAISVDIGIDLNGDQTITGVDQVFDYDELVTLTARNDFLELTLAGTGGNGALTYNVQKDGAGPNLITAGNVAQINTNGYTDGAVSYLCEVTDTKGITAAQTINLVVDNIDSTPPTAKITAFYDRYEGTKYLYVKNHEGSDTWGYWLEAGSLFIPWSLTGATTIGHIEPADSGNTNGWDPDVSGTLLVRGEIHDDQRIKTVTIWVDKDNDSVKDPAELVEVATSVATSDNLIDANGANGLVDDPDKPETITESGGHSYYFVYSWDTSEIDGMAAYDITIEVMAEDWNSGTTTQNAAVDENDSDYNAIDCDVMPYISSVNRDTGKTTNRSKQGRYPVMQGETSITLNGWNLGTTSTTNTMLLEKTGSHSLTADATWPASGGDSVTFDMTAAGNGTLKLTVSSIPLLNNNNDNTRLQNKEDDETGNALLSSLWSDDREFRIWDTGDFFNNSNYCEHISMSIYDGNYSGSHYLDTGNSLNEDGMLVGSFVLYSNSSVNFSFPVGDGDTTHKMFDLYDPSEFTNIYVDSSARVNVAFVSNVLGGAGWTNESGSVNAWSQFGPQYAYPDNSYSPDLPNLDGENYWASERLYYNTTLWQFHDPKVIRNGSDVHQSYYDTNTQAIKYVYYSAGWSGTNLTPWVKIDGSSDSDDTTYGNGSVSTFTGGLSVSAAAGEYHDLFFDDENHPLIIYYDTANQTLRLARTETVTPDLNSEWTVQKVFPGSDSKSSFSGNYVSALSDSNGDIHAAFYRVNTGDLLYITALDNGDGSGWTDYTFSDSVIIDEVGAVGSGADIALSGTTPYISYIDNSKAGTNDAIKVAYKEGANWEYETLPLESASVENKTEIEYSVNPAKNWEVAVGYKSNNSSRFEIIYLLKDL